WCPPATAISSARCNGTRFCPAIFDRNAACLGWGQKPASADDQSKSALAPGTDIPHLRVNALARLLRMAGARQQGGEIGELAGFGRPVNAAAVLLDDDVMGHR